MLLVEWLYCRTSCCTVPQVRPYLMADGGDVEVVDVSSGRVFLRLQASKVAADNYRIGSLSAWAWFLCDDRALIGACE